MAKRLFIAALVPVALGLGCILYLYLSAEAAPFSLNLISSDKTYRVELNEHADTYRHWAPIRLRLDTRRFNDVRFSAFKGDHKLATDESLWDTSSDPRFLESYRYQWVNNSVLRFTSDRSLSEPQLDEVTVLNGSSEPIDELRIESNDIFLVLDLQPKTAINLRARPQSWLGWVSCKGKFASQKQIPFYGVDFPIHDTDGNHAPQRYCILLTDKGTSIQSRDVEGNRDDDGTRVIIPKGTCAGTNIESQR